MLTLNVNGRARSIDVEPEMPLLWVLRGELNLPGAKYGCGAGLCGACTVQAPHSPTPQPYLAPGRLSSPRSTHKSGISGSTSIDRARPLTFRVGMR